MKISERIKQIQFHGLSQADIAYLVGCSQGHISDLLSERRGKRVGYELATRLIELQKKLDRKTRKQA